MRAAASAALLLLPVLLAGCTDEAEPALGGCAAPLPPLARQGLAAALPVRGARATPPAAPLEVRLELCDPRGFFGPGSEVRLLVTTPHEDGQRVAAGIVLPPGAAWVGPAPSFHGAVAAHAPQVLRGVARAEAPGEHVLRGWAELRRPGWNEHGSRAAPADLLGVRGGAGAPEVFEPACHGRHRPHPACEGAPVQLRIAADPDDVERVTATVATTAPLAARAMFYTGASFAEGERRWEVQLDPQEASRFAATVVLPENWIQGKYGGHYVVTFYLYPDAAVDGRIHEASLYYTAQDGQVTVSDQRPPDG